MVFSPRQSQIRKQNEAQYPRWFKGGPVTEDHWGLALQTLEPFEYISNKYTAIKDTYEGREKLVAFSSDGKYLAFSAWNTITLWNPTTGTLESVLEGHRGIISSMTFSRNGQLASASIDGEIRIWDPVTGVTCRKLEANFLNRDIKTVAVAFAPNGTLAISCETAIQIWNVDTGTFAGQMKSSYTVEGLTFLSNGTLALVCSSRKGDEQGEGEIELYDPETSVKRRIPTTSFAMAAFSTNNQLALASQDGKIWIYDLTTESCLNLEARVYRISALTFSFSNESLFFGHDDGSVSRWDLKSRTETFLATCLGYTRSIASSPDSKLAIVSQFSKEVWLWDVAPILPSPSPGASLKIGPASTIGKRLSVRKTMVWLMVFSQDGKWFASAHVNTICLWDPATQRLIRVLEVSGMILSGGISLSASGHHLAIASIGRTVQVWNPASGRLLQELKGHSAWVEAIAFSPDDKVVVSGDQGGMVKFWDSNSWDLKTTLSLRDSIRSIALSHDGRRVACRIGGAGEEIEIWDAEQYIHLRSLRNIRGDSEYDHQERQISFSADGTYIDTAFGRIQLGQSSTSSLTELSPIIKRWAVKDNWLIRDGQELLWLPHDFRPIRTAIHGDLFALGHRSGEVTFFQGDTHALTRDRATPDPAYDTTATEDK